MEERNCRNCMFIGKGAPYKFHGPSISSAYTPSRWHWNGGCCINKVDVFLWEVYENTKKICLTKGTSGDAGYVLNEVFFFLCEFLGKDYEYGPWIWDEGCAKYIIDGEKPQSNGVQVEFGE